MFSKIHPHFKSFGQAQRSSALSQFNFGMQPSNLLDALRFKVITQTQFLSGTKH
jgi:hypothetical protein